MSCGDRVTDCKYNCPNRLSDGRHFTDYRPRCFTNFDALPKPMSSYDYRMYLTHQAEHLIEQNRQDAFRKNMCEPCVNPSTMLPEQHVQVCDGRKCSFPVNDPNGLGLGRKYGGAGHLHGEAYSVKGCELPIMNQEFAPVQ